jgi:AraC-like DNA-binding protein
VAKHIQRRGDPVVLLVEARKRLASKVESLARSEGVNLTSIDGLAVFRNTAAGACSWTTYEPRFTVFLQGRKVIVLGATEYLCDGSSFLLSAVDVPVQSRIVEASEALPLLGMYLRLDMAVVQEVLSRNDLPERERSPVQRALAVGETTPAMLSACTRLLELLDSPEDIPFLSPLIQREIIYRILKTPQGNRLRAIATRGDLSNKTARAIAWLKANFTKPLRMDELAGMARMGVSTLHHQFRAMTGMSPLQYQKQLRLQDARRRMLAEGLDATSAAYEVGYQSVSQFSREYRRFFGQPPKRDVGALRGAKVTAIDAA